MLVAPHVKQPRSEKGWKRPERHRWQPVCASQRARGPRRGARTPVAHAGQTELRQQPPRPCGPRRRSRSCPAAAGGSGGRQRARGPRPSLPTHTRRPGEVAARAGRLLAPGCSHTLTCRLRAICVISLLCWLPGCRKRPFFISFCFSEAKGPLVPIHHLKMQSMPLKKLTGQSRCPPNFLSHLEQSHIVRLQEVDKRQPRLRAVCVAEREARATNG